MTQDDQDQINSLRAWVELVKDRNDFVIGRIEVIGSKALGVFTVSALAIGIAIPLGATNMPSLPEALTILLTGILILSVVCFLITTIAFVLTYNPALYKVGPSPKSILRYYVERESSDAYKNLLYWMGEWWTQNVATDKSKAKWLRVTIFSSAAEIILIGVWGVLLFVFG